MDRERIKRGENYCRMGRCLYLLALFAILAQPCRAQTDGVRRNWFNDPFFQISDGLANCPTPAGPFVTEKQRTAEAHHRAERGTSCWLAGKCDRPTSYAYDQDIASAFKAKLNEEQRNPFAGSTLWVTVQGRVVYIEGCAAEQGVVAALEAYARVLPYVEIAVARVRSDPTIPPPYEVLEYRETQRNKE
jgi:hypothetical protein